MESCLEDCYKVNHYCFPPGLALSWAPSLSVYLSLSPLGSLRDSLHLSVPVGLSVTLSLSVSLRLPPLLQGVLLPRQGPSGSPWRGSQGDQPKSSPSAAKD